MKLHHIALLSSGGGFSSFWHKVSKLVQQHDISLSLYILTMPELHVCFLSSLRKGKELL